MIQSNSNESNPSGGLSKTETLTNGNLIILYGGFTSNFHVDVVRYCRSFPHALQRESDSVFYPLDFKVGIRFIKVIRPIKLTEPLVSGQLITGRSFEVQMVMREFLLRMYGAPFKEDSQRRSLLRLSSRIHSCTKQVTGGVVHAPKHQQMPFASLGSASISDLKL